ncbi:MAG: pyrimidine utilization protein D [Pseudomonadota bacterium]|nr:pyrimidine utilization protein D [Pseudomonadota bacterium]
MSVAAGLFYELHGPDGAPPLILSAGLGGSAQYWQPNLAALAEHCRVLVYDHRGTGRSDRSLPDTVSVDDFADDMLALMDAVGWSRARIVGHAAGGVAGLALALKAPDRVERLVVVNGWAKAEPHFLRCFAARLALLRACGAEAYVRAQPIFLYPANWSSAHDAEIEADIPAQIAHFPGAETMEKRIAALAGFDIVARLSEIVAPVLLVAASDDVLVPSRASEMLAAGLPHGQLALAESGGHAYNITEADDFNEFVLGWLSGDQEK